MLSIDHQWIAIDILKGGFETPEFLKMNPNGKIPLLVTAEGHYLAESNAILFYLALDSFLLAKNKLQLARVLQWQFFEQNSHEPYIAVARYIMRYLGMPEERREQLQKKQFRGYQALDLMENHLVNNSYLVGNQCTIADISLYAYTHVADEGGFDLSGYSAILNWLDKIQSLDGYVGMNG